MSASGPLRVRPDLVLPADEIEVSYTRSGGPGGQNVNKVESCAILRFSISNSRTLSEDQKRRLRAVLGSRITSEEEILIRADRHRERRRNEGDARDRLATVLSKALLPPRIRKPSRPSRGSVERRLESKRRRSTTKRARRVEDG
jgi:ribosome-associated protein